MLAKFVLGAALTYVLMAGAVIGAQALYQMHEETVLLDQARTDAAELRTLLLEMAELKAKERKASWYARGLKKPDALTCASREHKRGTKLHLENLANGKRVLVKVNDFGPEEWTGRDLDLSRGAARKLGYLREGEATLRILETQ